MEDPISVPPKATGLQTTGQMQVSECGYLELWDFRGVVIFSLRGLQRYTRRKIPQTYLLTRHPPRCGKSEAPPVMDGHVLSCLLGSNLVHVLHELLAPETLELLK